MFSILKNELDKIENEEMETVEKEKNFDGQGVQSFTFGFGDWDEHQDSPNRSRLRARETAFESASRRDLGLPVARSGGRWLSDEKGKAKRGESARIDDEGAKKNNNKQTKTKAQNPSPLSSLPPKSFHKPRKFDRGKLAKAARDSVASLTNEAVIFSGSTMFPSQQSEPKEEIENVWFGSEKGKNFKDDDQVMMITVPKHGRQCDVLYLNAASSSEDIQMANRASFPVGTFALARELGQLHCIRRGWCMSLRVA